MSEVSTAKAMLKNLQRAFPRKHEFQIVDGSRFLHVSQKFYELTCRQLGDLGFRLLGDIEDVTAKRNKPDLRTFLRLMVDRQNTTVAACYHLAPMFLWRPVLWILRVPQKVVEFESYSGSEYTHCTTITPQSISAPQPHTMTKDCVPRNTALTDMYGRHRESITSLPHPLKSIHTVSEALNQQVAQHAQRRSHFERIGWVTRDYIRKQGVSPSRVDAIYQEIQNLLQSGYEAES